MASGGFIDGGGGGFSSPGQGGGFSEQQHPRGYHGRFASTGGAANSPRQRGAARPEAEGQSGSQASPAEHAAAQAFARHKIESAPVPGPEAVEKAREELAKAQRGEGRAGGDARGGSAADRRRQRQNLFKEAGGEERGYVACHGCGTKTHWDEPGSEHNPEGYARFERGKIFVKVQGGGYQLPNLLPECFACNRHRGDQMLRPENAPD